MEQLEIKHLGRRLAYGLKVLDGWGDVRTMKYHHLDDENDGFITGVKPFLRPLSDLTKEINHNGETFVPIVELLKIKHQKWFNKHLDSRYSQVEFKQIGNNANACFKYMATMSMNVWLVGLPSEEFWIIEKLLEWQFRIDEPEGTWIDVNALPKNPYE